MSALHSQAVKNYAIKLREGCRFSMLPYNLKKKGGSARAPRPRVVRGSGAGTNDSRARERGKGGAREEGSGSNEGRGRMGGRRSWGEDEKGRWDEEQGRGSEEGREGIHWEFSVH